MQIEPPFSFVFFSYLYERGIVDFLSFTWLLVSHHYFPLWRLLSMLSEVLSNLLSLLKNWRFTTHFHDGSPWEPLLKSMGWQFWKNHRPNFFFLLILTADTMCSIYIYIFFFSFLRRFFFILTMVFQTAVTVCYFFKKKFFLTAILNHRKNQSTESILTMVPCGIVVKNRPSRLLPHFCTKTELQTRKKEPFFPLFGFFSFLHHFSQSWVLFSSFSEPIHLVSKVLVVYF